MTACLLAVSNIALIGVYVKFQKNDPRNEKSDFRYEMQINGRRI